MRGRKPSAEIHGASSDSDRLPVPEYLGDAEAAIWEEVMATPAGRLITAADGRLLVSYVRAVAMDDRLTRALAEADLLTEGQRGARMHPAVTEARQQRTLIRQLASELGLSPTSRRAVTPGPKSREIDPDSDEAFMASL